MMLFTSAGIVDKSWICRIGLLLCFNGSDGKKSADLVVFAVDIENRAVVFRPLLFLNLRLFSKQMMAFSIKVHAHFGADP